MNEETSSIFGTSDGGKDFGRKTELGTGSVSAGRQRVPIHFKKESQRK